MRHQSGKAWSGCSQPFLLLFLTCGGRELLWHRSVKSIFLFYQNAAALLMFIPAHMGLLSRFGMRKYALWDTALALEVGWTPLLDPFPIDPLSRWLMRRANRDKRRSCRSA